MGWRSPAVHLLGVILALARPALAEDPEPLGKKEVQAGLTDKAFKGAVMACMGDYMPPGKIWLHVTITFDGVVSINAIKPKPPEDGIDACIREAASQASFRKSAKTINVIWPFESGSGSGVWVKKAPPPGEEPVVEAAVEGEAAPPEEGTGGGALPCEPPCRSGYYCKDGVCTSMCNPPCASEEKCDPDMRDCVPKSPPPPAASTYSAPPPPAKPKISDRYTIGGLHRGYKHARSLYHSGIVLLVLSGLCSFTAIMLGVRNSTSDSFSRPAWGASIGLGLFGGIFFVMGLPMTIVGGIKKGFYQRRIDNYSLLVNPWLVDRTLSF